jgi:hypothetical protein
VPWLSEGSLNKLERRIEALEVVNKDLEEKSKRIAHRYHALERMHSTLLLKIGLLGYNVEPVPEIPARPATVRLSKVKEK